MTAVDGLATVGKMFERFTSESRRAVVLAQEEARLLGHNYIGTEHLLCGLLHGDGATSTAAHVLDLYALDIERARRNIEDIVGQGAASPPGHIPFTPRAKKALEYSLREALQLGHNYIGGEHVLLGIARAEGSVGAQILSRMGADLESLRSDVVELITTPSKPATEPVPQPEVSEAITEFNRRIRQDAEAYIADRAPYRNVIAADPDLAAQVIQDLNRNVLLLSGAVDTEATSG